MPLVYGCLYLHVQGIAKFEQPCTSSQSWLQFLSKQCNVDIYKSIKHINYM